MTSRWLVGFSSPPRTTMRKTTVSRLWWRYAGYRWACFQARRFERRYRRVLGITTVRVSDE